MDSNKNSVGLILIEVDENFPTATDGDPVFEDVNSDFPNLEATLAVVGSLVAILLLICCGFECLKHSGEFCSFVSKKLQDRRQPVAVLNMANLSSLRSQPAHAHPEMTAEEFGHFQPFRRSVYEGPEEFLPPPSYELVASGLPPFENLSTKNEKKSTMDKFPIVVGSNFSLSPPPPPPYVIYMREDSSQPL